MDFLWKANFKKIFRRKDWFRDEAAVQIKIPFLNGLLRMAYNSDR